MAFRIIDKVQIQDKRMYVSAFADSTDTKPVEVEGHELAEGSICLESDTGDAYLFNEGGNAWVKQ